MRKTCALEIRLPRSAGEQMYVRLVLVLNQLNQSVVSASVL